MRLQLIGIVCGLMVSTASASAQDTGDLGSLTLRSSSYVDDDQTTVNSGLLAMRGNASEDLSLSVRYLVDATSSASVDVVSAATGRWTEVRSEAFGGIDWRRDRNLYSASYTYSDENDWTSHSGGLGVVREYDSKNVLLGLSGGYVANSVGRSGDANFSEILKTYSLGASGVWIGSPTSIYSLRYSLTYNRGFQASPYRFSRLLDPSGVFLNLPEAHPDLRVRHALVFSWNRHLFNDVALRSHTRGYIDDWGILSATGGTEIVVGTGNLEFSGSVRGYLQKNASFYEDIYTTQKVFMSADRELSSFGDLFAGVGAGWHREGETLNYLGIDAHINGFVFYFDNFSRLPRRVGLVADLGLVIRI